jgi:osmotically-inducible protein OsmY
MALSCLLALPSCFAVVLGGAAATGGYVAGQERGVNDTASDARIRTEINNAWFKYDSDMAQQLNLSIYEGDVLITGAVSNPEWKDAAVRLVWKVDGVKQVHSEIELADKSSFSDTARDKLITYRLRTAIIGDSKVRSINYTIDTVNGIVYLSGSARTQGELDLVTDYARNIPNVKRVVNYVHVRPGEPSAPPVADTSAPAPAATAQPAPVDAPAPQAAGSPPPSNSSSSSKIEVQPLQ